MSERLKELERIIPKVEGRAARLGELLWNHVGGSVVLAAQHTTCSDCQRIKSLESENNKLLQNLEKMKFSELVKPLAGQKILVVESDAYQRIAISLSIENSIWPSLTDSLPENLQQYLKDNKISGVIAHLDRPYLADLDLDSLQQTNDSGIPVVLLASATLEYGLNRIGKGHNYLDKFSIPKIEKSSNKSIEQAFVLLAKAFTDLQLTAST